MFHYFLCVSFQEADLAAAPLFITPSRKKVVAFTRPFLSVYATMLLRKIPDYSSTEPGKSTSNQQASSKSSPSHTVMSLADLINQSEIQYGTLDTGIFVRLFQMSNNTLLSQVWRNIDRFSRQGYDVLMPTNEQGIEKTRRERYAYILPSTIADYVVNRAPCDLTTVDRFLSTRGYGFALKRREDPLLAELNIALDSLDAERFLDRLYHKWWRLKGDCYNGAARRGSSTWVQVGDNGSRSDAGLMALIVICLVASELVVRDAHVLLYTLHSMFHISHCLET